jgi:UDP-3-O-[3-hydroxymyristoyl] glucosamine N-acyltransferase
MGVKVKELAELTGAKIFGDENLEIENVAKIQDAQAKDLALLYLKSYEKYAAVTNAGCLLIDEKIERKRDDLTYLVHSAPRIAFLKILKAFFDKPVDITQEEAIDPTAKIGENVKLGCNVIIGANCEIGAGTVIGHNTVILADTKLGENCFIYPNVTIRENCIIGNNVIMHSGVVIGSDGFGFEPDEKGVFHKVPQVGNVVIEDDVELGANVAIDRAALGSTIIRKGVKIDNLVQIGHNVEIGEHTVLSGQTGISGSTKIGSHVILAGQVGVAGHLEIADGTIVAAQSGVSKSLVKTGKYFGTPAKEMGLALKLEAHVRSLPKYAERIKALEKELEELKQQINR